MPAGNPQVGERWLYNVFSEGWYVITEINPANLVTSVRVPRGALLHQQVFTLQDFLSWHQFSPSFEGRHFVSRSRRDLRYLVVADTGDTVEVILEEQVLTESITIPINVWVEVYEEVFVVSAPALAERVPIRPMGSLPANVFNAPLPPLRSERVFANRDALPFTVQPMMAPSAGVLYQEYSYGSVRGPALRQGENAFGVATSSKLIEPEIEKPVKTIWEWLLEENDKNTTG